MLTIDSSQGREFDIVFVSMVRTNSGSFVHDRKRINVGITRAKHGLVIVGNTRALRKHSNWRRLLDVKANNVVNGIEAAKVWMENEIKKFIQKGR